MSEDAAGVHLEATYPPAALGLAGSAPVTVALTIGPDQSVTARYDAPLTTAGGSAASPGGTATVETIVTPSPGQQSIAPPTGASPAPSS